MTPTRIPRTSGIYRIICTTTGRFYIGSALDLNKRWRDHFTQLRHNIHGNPKLQAAWNKYGEQAFLFEVLEPVLLPEMLTAREQHFLDTLKPFEKRGFNIARIAGSTLGMKRSPEAIEKTRTANLGNTHRLGSKATPETIERLRVSHLGKSPGIKTRLKLSEAGMNRIVSAETGERIRLAKLGKKRSPEVANNLRTINIGRKHDPTVYAGRMKTLIITSPDGTESVVTGIKKFCQEHNLDVSSLMRTAKGFDRGTVCSQHKGYKARFL